MSSLAITRFRAVLLLFCAAGCGGGGHGPELGAVDGVVHLDGKPLPGALIVFVPENGSPSRGFTDEEGRYTLAYSRDHEGAEVGKHTVRISTGQPADEDEDGNPTPAVPEKVPVEYNQQSTLTADVKPGSNEIDFKDLKSGGQIVQPESQE